MNEVGGKLDKGLQPEPREESGQQCLVVRRSGQLRMDTCPLGCAVRSFWCLGKNCTKGKQ